MEIEKGPVDLFPTEPTDEDRQVEETLNLSALHEQPKAAALGFLRNPRSRNFRHIKNGQNEKKTVNSLFRLTRFLRCSCNAEDGT